MFSRFFYSKVLPMLLYSAEVRGIDIDCNSKPKIVNMVVCKSFLDVNMFTSNHVVRGSQRDPIYIYIYSLN